MKFGVVVFPGSNCDNDLIHVLENVMHQQVVKLWHKDTTIGELTSNDCIMLPGGFSYGDYLRSGALASQSNIMNAIKQHASQGGYVWGICNGFQILCEAGLLPGALLRNDTQKFSCQNVFIKPNNQHSKITENLDPSKAYKIPIAHAEGRYYADEVTLQNMAANHQILFEYCDHAGNITIESNPNGSTHNIAGICNATHNVFGMMPHPERASEQLLGNADGAMIFNSFIHNQLVH
jgi:phosphoribosylformylglycinamidine synthase